MSVEFAKGTRNISPEEGLIREEVVTTIKEFFRRYGFKPLETPILQRYEELTAKYAGGAEIMKEIFQLQDQGKRNLALRYDLTVPLALYMTENPTVKLPFKRYEIGKVFRDGPIKKGRTREFWQCDADMIGSSSLIADAECINLMQDVFDALQVKVKIKVNNIKILHAMMRAAGATDTNSAILTIDKLDKVGKESVVKELLAKGCSEETITKIFEYIAITDLAKLGKVLDNEPGIVELTDVLKNTKAVFDPTLARGLAYYTGTILEVYAEKSAITSSLGSGGRYDKMIGDYLQSKQAYPAVGISFGLEPITEVLKEQRKEAKKTATEVFVIPIQTPQESLRITQELRAQGVNAEIDVMNRNVGKNIEYANTMGIPFVLFVGSDEIKRKKFKLRDMNTGKEELYIMKECVERVTNARKV